MKKNLTPDQEKKINQRVTKDIERKLNMGLKPYDYGPERIVWARNKKNADRKARNNGWI